MGGESGGTVVMKSKHRVRACYPEMLENYWSKDDSEHWNVPKMILRP